MYLSETVAREQFDKLTASDKLDLRKGIENLHKEMANGAVPVATGCSGTDLVLAALESLFDMWSSMFGIDLSVDHLYSCESKPFKQRFLQENFHPPHIFPDLVEMKHKSVVNLEGHDVVIRTPFMWICGIECDSISSLNANRSGNFDCVAQEKESKTGITGKACMEYIAAHRPPTFLLECVRNLQVVGKSGKSNLQLLQEFANNIGYLLLSKAMNAFEYGVPQQRDRAYLLGILIASHRINQARKGWALPPWVRQFTNVVLGMKINAQPLDNYLLPEDDPSVRLANVSVPTDKPLPKKKVTRKPKPIAAEDGSDMPEKKQKSESSGLAYEVEHLSQYFAAQVRWPPEMDAEFLLRAASCTERQKQVLWLLEQTQGKVTTLKTLLVRDLHMSAEWQVEREGYMPCIVSSSALWVRGASRGQYIERFLSGAELLCLQGLDYGRQNLEGFSHSNLVDLAGNAFCSAVIFPLITGLFCCAPLAEAIKLSKMEFESLEEEGEESEAGGEADPVLDVSGDEQELMDFDIDDMEVGAA